MSVSQSERALAWQQAALYPTVASLGTGPVDGVNTCGRVVSEMSVDINVLLI